MVRVAVIGSRKFGQHGLIRKVLSEEVTSNDRLISGGAPGPDTVAEAYAKSNEIQFLRIPAQWDRYGKRAGFIRNPLIIAEADKVIAFWDGKSRGTLQGIVYANKIKRPVLVVFPDGRSKSNKEWDKE